MTETRTLSRRSLLASAAALGVTVNFLGNVAFAAADGALAKRKLVVIVCRGAMDGLSVFPPVGEPGYAALRGPIAVPAFGTPGGALKIDGHFGLHPSLVSVHKLALAGKARIAPAVATPDRSRSHFEGQDVLESGVGTTLSSSGWLNRAMQAISVSRKVSGLSIGTEMPLILRGKLPVTTWAPGRLDSENERLTQVLSDLYAHDALLGPALASGLEASAIAEQAGVADAERPRRRGGGGARAMHNTGQADQAASEPARRRDVAKDFGKAVAALMAAEHGPSIAAISLNGFDTHAKQKDRVAERLGYLDSLIDGIAVGLGAKWSDTAVVAVTEFGRTAHVNGNQGTDHGTASAALLAGGAVKAGGIIGDWPTLQQARLYENRDLAPTLDMRGLLKGVLAEHLALDKGQLETVVFPDSARAAPASNLIG